MQSFTVSVCYYRIKSYAEFPVDPGEAASGISHETNPDAGCCCTEWMVP